MQQFIPFEDDWDALEQLRPEALIPYRVGLVQARPPAGGEFGARKATVAAPVAMGGDDTLRSGSGN